MAMVGRIIVALLFCSTTHYLYYVASMNLLLLPSLLRLRELSMHTLKARESDNWGKGKEEMITRIKAG